MITSDKKKSALLGVLVILAVLSWYFVMRPAMTTTTVGPATKPPGATKPIKLGPATIDLALLKEQSTNDVGQKNIFSFREKPAPKPMPTVVAAQSFPVSPPQPQTFAPPPPPPPPPFRAFKYEGLSVIKNSGRILGALSEGGNSYQVKEGDCLMGQYCITRLTERDIEIEDLQLKRRQTFTRVQ
jgi:hypothetical protein